MNADDLNHKERECYLKLRRGHNKATNHQLAEAVGHRFGARIHDLRALGFDIPRPRKPKEGELGVGPPPEGITIYEIKGWPKDWTMRKFSTPPPPVQVPLPMSDF